MASSLTTTLVVAATSAAVLLAGLLIADPLVSLPAVGLGHANFGPGHDLPSSLSVLINAVSESLSGPVVSHVPPSRGSVPVEVVVNMAPPNTTDTTREHTPDQWDAIRVREVDPKGFFQLGDDGVLRSFDSNKKVAAYRRLSPAEIRIHVDKFVKASVPSSSRNKTNQIFRDDLVKRVDDVYEGVDGRAVLSPMDLWYPSESNDPEWEPSIQRQDTDGRMGISRYVIPYISFCYKYLISLHLP